MVTCTIHGRVITVNNAGNDSDECCGDGVCPCSSLSYALQNLINHAIINITSVSVSLENITEIVTINNVTISGNDNIIRCNNTGAIHCISCIDITIEGITFDQCGHYSQGGLSFLHVLNITIKNCTFQNSKQCAVVTFGNANGNVTIKMNNFISNVGDIDSLHCSGLGIFYGKHISTIVLDENSFYNNGYQAPLHSSQTGNLYAAFIAPYNSAYPTSIDIVMLNTAFVNNNAGLSMIVYACSAEIHMHNMYVCSNGRNAGILISIIDGCQHYLTVSSSSFVSNVNSLAIVTVSRNSEANIEATIEIFNSTFLFNKARKLSLTYATRALSIDSSISKSEVTITNCSFLNNFDGAIVINITPSKQTSNCSLQNIRLSNVLV